LFLVLKSCFHQEGFGSHEEGGRPRIRWIEIIQDAVADEDYEEERE
jgi:hypothetical protein